MNEFQNITYFFFISDPSQYISDMPVYALFIREHFKNKSRGNYVLFSLNLDLSSFLRRYVGFK